MNRKTWLWVGGIVAIGAAGWYLTRSKQAYARAIVKNGGASNYLGLLRFDRAYLKEWAKAARLGTATFIHNGKVYQTVGGKTQKG